MKIKRKRREFSPAELVAIQEVAAEYTEQVQSKDPLTGLVSTMPVCKFSLSVTGDGIVIHGDETITAAVGGKLGHALSD